MARGKKKNKEAVDGLNVEEKKHSKIISIIIVVLIVLIWLGIFVVLIKLDVGNFGSSVLRPILKDVPVIKEILPNTGEEADNEDYPYKSLAEAIAYIKELEIQLHEYQESDSDNTAKIEQLQAEIERLKAFETEKVEFENLKSEFYEEVVYGDDAIDIENYKEYYESIDAENAAKLYQEVVEKQTQEEQYTDFAKTYSSMEPKEAAKIFLNMASDLDTVVGILNNMSASSRGSILGALSGLDAGFAAKVTQMLAP